MLWGILLPISLHALSSTCAEVFHEGNQSYRLSLWPFPAYLPGYLARDIFPLAEIWTHQKNRQARCRYSRFKPHLEVSLVSFVSLICEGLAELLQLGRKQSLCIPYLICRDSWCSCEQATVLLQFLVKILQKLCIGRPIIKVPNLKH